MWCLGLETFYLQSYGEPEKAPHLRYETVVPDNPELHLVESYIQPTVTNTWVEERPLEKMEELPIALRARAICKCGPDNSFIRILA